MKRFAKTKAPGFSLIEVLFAIAMLAVGVVGVISLFTAGINAATKSGKLSIASMEVQSLLATIERKTDGGTPAKRIFLNHIKDPANFSGSASGLVVSVPPDHEWLHAKRNDDDSYSFADNPDPVKIDNKRELYWKCRVSNKPADRQEPFKDGHETDPVSGGDYVYPPGLFQLTIAIYQNWSPDKAAKDPIVVYSTLITAGY